MATSRIAPLDPPYAEDIAAGFARVMPPGREPLKLFRTLAHNPRVLLRLFAGGLLDRGAVTLAEREIVILRACARAGGEYEWGVHVTFFSDRAGLSPSCVDATVLGRAEDPAFDADQRLLIRLVDSLHDTADIGDGLWNDLSERWEKPALIELIMLAGQYRMIGTLCRGLRVAREPDAAVFPER
ncbi:MAG: carboxymuconolactone decarboxylase family protein [Ferrovibrionaceae bacterium]